MSQRNEPRISISTISDALGHFRRHCHGVLFFKSCSIVHQMPLQLLEAAKSSAASDSLECGYIKKDQPQKHFRKVVDKLDEPSCSKSGK